MCGIFSAVKLDSFFTEVDNNSFVECTNLVSHRGPDSTGYLNINTSSQKFDKRKYNIFLGHTRLSIIDLSSAANQPFLDDDIYIAYNGEIFNFIELRTELKTKGHIFNSNTDTEVIIKIYREYGESGFSKLNGMWAFILVDQKRNRVIVSRDRFSIKPLYYYQYKDELYFSSEIRQLLPIIKDKEINYKKIYVFIKQGILDYDNDTFFKYIKKIPPKKNMVLDLHKQSIKFVKYWDYEIIEINSFSEAIEKFRYLFFESIRLRLRSDVRLGSLLSGGLDSSAITVVADKLLGGTIQSFSVISTDKKTSEEKYINVLAQSNNIDNKKLNFDYSDVLKYIENVVTIQEEPFSTFSVIAQYLIFKKIKEETDIKVVLCGQGGDELLMGYLKYFFFHIKDLYRDGKYFKLFNNLVRSIIYRTAVWDFKLSNAKRYMPGVLKSSLPYIKCNHEVEDIWTYENILSRQKSDIDKYSVPILARYEDKNSMANSIESRLPFLDHRLVNLLVSINVDYKIKNGWTKFVLRKSLNELPKAIRWRRDKKGFSVPENIWIKKLLNNKIKDYLNKSRLASKGIIDADKFLSCYDLFCSKQKSGISCHDIIRVFLTEVWLRNFVK